MIIRQKSSYHPYVLIAFYLKCLPDDLAHRIPRSTRHEWIYKDQATLFGYDWYRQNKNLFDTLQQVIANKRLLQINRSLLRVIALHRFIRRHSGKVKENIGDVNRVVLSNLCKISVVIGVKTALKYLQQSYCWYLQLRNTRKCRSSLLTLCRVKHSAQLLAKEINTIKTYCLDGRFLHWPLISVYHQIRREKAATFNASTFYKYVSILNLKRTSPGKRRMNHTVGIRAHAPLQILHADTTVFRTSDNVKNYIYLIQNNYSRAILSYRVARECNAQIAFETLVTVYEQYLRPREIQDCQLITDDGSENLEPVKSWIDASKFPSIRHQIAQKDIMFSNSMIEAANKQLKYRFLYHHYIPEHNTLIKYVNDAVQDYNHRPHDVLHGLTPFEVLHGGQFDNAADRQQILLATASRLAENKKARCCYYSF